MGHRYLEVAGAPCRPEKNIAVLSNLPNLQQSSMSVLKRNPNLLCYVSVSALAALTVLIYTPVTAQADSSPEKEKNSNATSMSAVVAGPAVTRAQVLPRDEAHRDPALIKFRQRLLQIVRRRDADALEDCLSKDVLVGLGGGIGKDNFYAIWKPEHNADFWAKLNFALSHGGYFESDSQHKFTAPYYDFYPDGLPEADTQTRGIIVDKEVELKDKPGGATTARLSFDLVHVLDDSLKPSPEGSGWTHIKTLSGEEGYVRTAQVHSQTEPFAEFTRHGNRWFLSAFGSASP